jgi:hypothetical protein
MGDVLDFERTSPFSLSIWYNTLGATGIRVLIGKLNHASPYNGYNLLLSSGKIQFQLVNTWLTNYLLVDSSGSTYNSTGWKHLVLTYNGSSNSSGVKMYINGSPISTTSVANTLTSSTLTSIQFTIGTRNNNAYYWSGLIDQTAVWNKELTQSQITKLYNSGSGLSYINW